MNGHTSGGPPTGGGPLDAIGALDDRPSSVARSLSPGTPMVVAVVLPWFTVMVGLSTPSAGRGGTTARSWRTAAGGSTESTAYRSPTIESRPAGATLSAASGR